MMNIEESRQISVRVDMLEPFVATVFEHTGMATESARRLAQILVKADLRGTHTHGVSRVSNYVDRLLGGRVNANGTPHVFKSDSAVILVDADNAMGHLAAAYAMEQAIERARATGVAAVSVRHSNHCGAMAFYPMMALAEDMIGLATTQALPTMAPWGGVDQLLGNNPLAVAIPTEKERPVVLDTPFQNSFPLKIEARRERGLPIPADWSFDAEGRPTTDPDEALKGFGQPVGGYRGVGLALVMGVFATLLSGTSWGRELGSIQEGAHPGEDGHFFMAFDISAFEEVGRFKQRMDQIVREMHASRRAAGVERILVPGERSAECEERYRADGIPLPLAVVAGLADVAERVGGGSESMRSLLVRG
jgi:LDH2 family malate/lactate/ureidoglycolate dehydrogenase